MLQSRPRFQGFESGSADLASAHNLSHGKAGMARGQSLNRAYRRLENSIWTWSLRKQRLPKVSRQEIIQERRGHLHKRARRNQRGLNPDRKSGREIRAGGCDDPHNWQGRVKEVFVLRLVHQPQLRAQFNCYLSEKENSTWEYSAYSGRIIDHLRLHIFWFHER